MFDQALGVDSILALADRSFLFLISGSEIRVNTTYASAPSDVSSRRHGSGVCTIDEGAQHVLLGAFHQHIVEEVLTERATVAETIKGWRGAGYVSLYLATIRVSDV